MRAAVAAQVQDERGCSAQDGDDEDGEQDRERLAAPTRRRAVVGRLLIPRAAPELIGLAALSSPALSVTTLFVATLSVTALSVTTGPVTTGPGTGGSVRTLAVAALIAALVVSARRAVRVSALPVGSRRTRCARAAAAGFAWATPAPPTAASVIVAS